MVPCNSLLLEIVGVFILWGDILDSDTKKEIRDKMFEVRLKQPLYTMEHKEESSELLEELKALRKESAHQLTIEMNNNEKGDINNVEHKRK